MSAPYVFNIITLFPEYFNGVSNSSLIGKAVAAGSIGITLVNPRDHADNPREVDDYSFGGGPGMVLMPGPLFAAAESIDRLDEGPVVCLSASGRKFTSAVAAEYAATGSITLICGRYEGVDERVCEHLCTDELSIGDYVLSGGEAAAAVVIDAVARLVPGVMGNLESATTESHSLGTGGLLEYPQYTRPADFRGWVVPDTLRSGDHGAIEQWRRRASLRKTAKNRPDLLRGAKIDEAERDWLAGLGLWAGDIEE